MVLAGIETRYLVNRMTELTRGHYIANIYGISRQSLLIKLHNPDRDDVLLMVTTRGVWPTNSRIEQIEPNSMVSRLRKSLARMRLVRIQQPGEERIIILDFEGVDHQMRIICEFFGDGNIILCDSANKIHALQHTVSVRHRTLKVGEQYELPPGSDLGAIGATHEDIVRICKTALPAAKSLARNVGLPSRYVERVFAEANVVPKTPGNELDDDAIRRIHSSLESIVSRVTDGTHEPETASTESGTMVNPVRLIDGATPAPGRTFEDLLDETFIAEIVESGNLQRSGKTEQRKAELESQIAEQDRAIELVKKRSQEISDLARAIQDAAYGGATSVNDEGITSILEAHAAQLSARRGTPVIRVAECEVAIPDSLHAISSALYDESKVQRGAESTIVTRQKKIRETLESLCEKATSEANIDTQRVRKKAWYERYRWFHTSDGLLAVGGRDASSNMSLIRKRIENDDIVFHADVFGSPFFVLKGGHDASNTSISEVAQATVCFSRAWREAMSGTDAFWVNPEQVKRAAPSGQFLPKGSFSIDGKRNFVKVPTLRLAIGAIDVGGAYTVSCGPLAAIRKSALCYCVVEPGMLSQTDTAKRIKTELVRLNGAASELSIDEISRAMSAGLSHIVESEVGDAKNN